MFNLSQDHPKTWEPILVKFIEGWGIGELLRFWWQV